MLLGYESKFLRSPFFSLVLPFLCSERPSLFSFLSPVRAPPASFMRPLALSIAPSSLSSLPPLPPSRPMRSLLSIRLTRYRYLPTTRPRCTYAPAQDDDFGCRREGAEPSAGAGRRDPPC